MPAVPPLPSSPQPPAPVPPLPPKASGKRGMYALIGCGAALVFAVIVVVVGAALWIGFSKKSPTTAGSSGSNGNGSSGGGSSSTEAGGNSNGNALGVGVRLSQFEHAAGSACIIGPDGTWHAVFQEKATYGKPVFIYHRASRDGGATWSAPEAISDDGTGNGSSYPRMGQDIHGNVFAAWVRFGKDNIVVAESTLDGPGGYVEGTLMLRRWNGRGWDATQTVGNLGSVRSFCFCNATDGSLQVVWGEQGGVILHCPATGGDGTVIVPEGSIPSDNPTYNRPSNLCALPDSKGGVIVLAERKYQNAQELILWHSGTLHVLASDPKYQTRNTFNYPSQMFADATGRIHVIHIPYPDSTAKAELWDLDPLTGQRTVIFTGRDAKDTIQNFQLASGIHGTAHITMQWSQGAAGLSDSTDVAALSFDGEKWSAPRGLTGNSRSESFFHKNLPGGEVAVLERYHARHSSMAVDAKGKVHALATIDAQSSFSTGTYQQHGGTNYNVVSGATISQPSVYVLPWR
ncbi:hypothetical protein [Roseimicrobium sp. ORNL1]|uniref:hypothetical protein n=1 Tax=Roseimicrobium sp. ORNL1 TaxID=2711231 RepID=UPI0013E13AE7|nr:hypothetical protein [Roseimicrobium sp. ORNL1]QIF01031.1 hypothetical protein G5S37_05690 [Roseimicrobium sp. ORNL1]